MFYQIKDLERLSGIKAHTIRIWEKRYSVIEPHRTPTNIRYYDDDQLRRLMNIAVLNNLGYKISKLVTLTPEELNDLLREVKKSSDKNQQLSAFISDLIVSGMTYDEILFNKTFDEANKAFGLNSTYVNIILPMLTRIGLLWLSEDMMASQEHFISNLLKQKLYSIIENLHLKKIGPKCLVFLTEGEQHEVGLLFAHYLLKDSGHYVINLGPNVPYDNLNLAIDETKPDKVYTFIAVSKENKALKSFESFINGIEGNVKCFVLGPEEKIKRFNFNREVEFISTIEDFKNKVNEL